MTASSCFTRNHRCARREAPWTQPELLKQWWAPKPWTTPRAELDVLPGGVGNIVMRSPEGQDMPCPGVYLEVVPNRRLVLTDAYREAWMPSAKSFMTVIVTFDDLGDSKTRYTARVRHWSIADRETHEKMGFPRGLGPLRPPARGTRRKGLS